MNYDSVILPNDVLILLEHGNHGFIYHGSSANRHSSIRVIPCVIILLEHRNQGFIYHGISETMHISIRVLPEYVNLLSLPQ